MTVTGGREQCSGADDQVRSASGIPVPAVAGPEHVRPGLDERLGEPGEPPFTRGIHPTMYRTRPWTIRQLAGFGSARDTNLRYRLLLERGATGINGVFDYPSLRSWDSDDPLAAPDVGRGGVAVDVTDDFADLFDGIPLDATSVSLVSSQPIGAVPHLAMYLVAAERRGFPWSSLRGTSQNDFLMETCITIGPRALSPAASFRLECDLAEFCVANVPRWNPVSVAGYNYREAGADAALEVALTVAHGRSVAQELVRRGVDAVSALSRISFFLNAHNDVFEEVAKFRAARRIWSRVVREQLGCSDPAAAKFRFHVQSSGMTSSAEQPLVNIARGALQCLAAVLGGAQSIHVNGYDEALAIPTEEAATVALRTQQVILMESGVARSADPLAGSYLVEYMTDELESRIESVLDAIDANGGVVAATESGWVHRELSRLAYEHQRKIDSGDAPFVGVNVERMESSAPVQLFEIPVDTVERQAARLREVRETRDAGLHAKAIAALDAACASGVNVLPAALEAVRADATLGEIGEVFRSVLGTWEFPLW